MKTLSFTLFLICMFAIEAKFGEAHKIVKRHSTHWSYDDHTGAAHWPKMFKKCGGYRQSPIDIITSEADHNSYLNNFEFSASYGDFLEGAKIENNGHTIQVKAGAKDRPRTFTEGGFDDDFQFEQLHFHWGSDSKKGSEHLIDGQAFPLEMHLVHRNTDYKSLQEALHKEDGLAVLGVLFKVTDEDNPALGPIIDKLDDVRKQGSSDELDSLQLRSLLPDNLMPYYRYYGSLTTPPCFEVVTWTVFKDYVTISERQLEQFRTIKREEGGQPEEILVNNYRPVEPMNGRVVQVSDGAAKENDINSITESLKPLIENKGECPQETGKCQARFQHYHILGENCKLFTYGCCGGNPNNSPVDEACIAKCMSNSGKSEENEV